MNSTNYNERTYIIEMTNESTKEGHEARIKCSDIIDSCTPLFKAFGAFLLVSLTIGVIIITIMAINN